MPVWIGTSGWQYRDWRGAFYPPSLPQREWLAHYAARFATVEVNNTFYRLPPRERFVAWAEQTPADFVVTVKASRYLSHVKRLREPAAPVARLLDAAAGLGGKLGPVLVQLPATFHADVGRLAAALAAFPAHVRVAVEVRHGSWFSDEARDLLAARDAALCWADRESRWLTPPWRTASWGYVRLHSGRGSPRPCYGRSALERCARDIAAAYGSGADVFVYTNNDPHCCAVRDARLLALACRRHGLGVTRVPAASEVHVGA